MSLSLSAFQLAGHTKKHRLGSLQSGLSFRGCLRWMGVIYHALDFSSRKGALIFILQGGGGVDCGEGESSEVKGWWKWIFTFNSHLQRAAVHHYCAYLYLRYQQN